MNLTKEEIEARGWKATASGIGFRYKETNIYCVPHIIKTEEGESHKITFHTIEPTVTLFEGECKDMNTFVEICNSLRIE
jgi:hypothetical protein